MKTDRIIWHIIYITLWQKNYRNKRSFLEIANTLLELMRNVSMHEVISYANMSL